ncbi:hypothetical protein N2W50_000297 [Clostridium perfringens]|nr:hypothetical protein [Clostridium perfringens]ELC8416098.1 hypothetical protein [Clostridium perfringens]
MNDILTIVLTSAGNIKLMCFIILFTIVSGIIIKDFKTASKIGLRITLALFIMQCFIK